MSKNVRFLDFDKTKATNFINMNKNSNSQTVYFLAKSFKKAKWQSRHRSLFHGWPNNDITHKR